MGGVRCCGRSGGVGCQILVDLLGKFEFFTVRLRSDKFNGNQNENENETENKSGGTCEGGAKRPPVGSFTRFVFGFVFVFVLISKKFVFPFFLPQTVLLTGEGL